MENDKTRRQALWRALHLASLQCLHIIQDHTRSIIKALTGVVPPIMSYPASSYPDLSGNPSSWKSSLHLPHG